MYPPIITNSTLCIRSPLCGLHGFHLFVLSELDISSWSNQVKVRGSELVGGGMRENRVLGVAAP